MLLWVNEAFEYNPDLLADYQERFLYFLVDEFQDTNGIQISILQHLIDHEWLDRPNVFVVGDDDQAIYRFQGANIENLIGFYQHYNPEVILLEENYRSSQLILNAARVVMKPVDNSLLQKMFGQTKKLNAGGPYAGHDHQVLIQSYTSQAHENAAIFQQVVQWHKEKMQGAFAVLYTKHDLGRDLSQALRGAGIPYQTPRTLDALSHPVIQHLLDIMLCIHQLGAGADNDDGLLYRVLHLRYMKPRTADLQLLILSYTSKDRKDPSTLYTWLSDSTTQDTLQIKDRTWMTGMFDLLEAGITSYHSMTLMSFVEWVAHQINIMSWILEQPEKFSHLYDIKTFYTFVDN
jgi:DNA helicase-2/ATP-dependent DNA helicase PcrA